jgi:hypothetical protein
MKFKTALFLSLAATSTFAAQEWKYTCQRTLLSGYQWNYVGSVPHSEAETSSDVCYGYSGLSNFCTEVRSGGVFGPVIACNFGTLGQAAYTWNKW